eukprot:3580388-Rhodomonas_salina.1
MMNGGAISWESKCQKVTALSSAESEFYAASAVGCELVFLRWIADAMGFKQSGPTPVYWLREFVQDCVMELYYVATSDQ